MPHVELTWRINPRWRWASRLLCRFGRHHWLVSKTLNANIACAVCSKKAKGFAEYVRLTKKDGA